MSGIRGKNTKPELLIRRGLHARGFRYRLHAKNLPGRPDLVFPSYRAVIFVNGCFWHGHQCPIFKWPSSREDFWHTKILGNQERDRRNTEQLLHAGWRILIIWECAMKGPQRQDANSIVNQAASWLRSDSEFTEIRGEQGGHC